VTRRTTDTPAQRPPRTGIDLSAVARRYATVLRLAYLACIAIATLLNLGIDVTPANVLFRLQRAIDPPIGFKDVVDAARNVALFLGWGSVWVLTTEAPTTKRDVLIATLTGMMASLTVEAIQLLSQFRMASVADVATNTLGSFIGAATLWIVERRAIGDLRRGTTIGIPGWLPAGALLLTAFGLAFAPAGRASMTVGWAPSPFERARFVSQAAALDVSWTALAIDAIAWLVVGISVALAIDDRDGKLRWRQLLAWLVIVPGLLLTAHYGRAMAGLQRESGSAIVQSVAAAIGLLSGLILVPRWRRRVTARSTRALQLGFLVLGVGVVMSWSPAAWAARAGATFSWRQLVPMMSLFQRQDLSSVFLVLQKAGLGAAVGACLAARTRVGEPSPGLRAAVLYAAILEAGQFFVPGRYPDVTDVLITSAAACLVGALVERADRGARLSVVAESSALNARR
jgi:VanZ family protein